MKKEFTHFALLLVIAILACPYSLLAQEEAPDAVGIFNFNKFDTPVSTNDSHDGDITEDLTLVDGDVTLTISPKELNKSTENRFWGTPDGPQLRMYSGTLDFKVIEGTAIRNIYFVYGRWNDGNSVSVGTLANATWSGEAAEVTIYIAGNSQISKIYVDVEPDTPEVEGIGEFKELSIGTKAILKLTDARVTYVKGDSAWVEDNTGAILFQNTKLPLQAGKILNGSLLAKYRLYYGTAHLFDVTKHELEQTDGEVEPNVTSVAGMLLSDSISSYVKTGPATISEGKIVEGDNIIEIVDLFGLDTVKGYSRVKSITGIVGHNIDLANANIFYPVSIELYEAKNIAELNTLPEGADVRLTVKDALTTFNYGGQTFLEDETGAVPIGTRIAVGKKVSGSIIGRYEPISGMPEFNNISEVDIEQTNGNVVATQMSIADMAKPENIWRLVRTGEVSVAEGKLIDNESDIAYYDKFGTGVLREVVSAKRVSGIIALHNGIYVLCPIEAADAVTTGIETIESLTATSNVWTLTGVRVSGEFKKGISIRNGQKFIIR